VIAHERFDFRADDEGIDSARDLHRYAIARRFQRLPPWPRVGGGREEVELDLAPCLARLSLPPTPQLPALRKKGPFPRFESLAQISPTRAKFRWIEPKVARHSADGLRARITPRDNRDLHLRRPFPSPARACENLEPLRTLGPGIVTRYYQSSSALLRFRARKLGANLQTHKVGRNSTYAHTKRRTNQGAEHQRFSRIWVIREAISPGARTKSMHSLSIALFGMSGCPADVGNCAATNANAA
jgi:hypothetical protein